MSGVEGFLLGLMVAWTPSLIVFAVLLWRAPVIEDRRAGQRAGQKINTAS
jgi:hypothetical protein